MESQLWKKFKTDLTKAPFDGVRFSIVINLIDHSEFICRHQSEQLFTNCFTIEDVLEIEVLDGRMLNAIKFKKLGNTDLDFESYKRIYVKPNTDLEILIISQIFEDNNILSIGETSVAYNLLDIPHFQVEISGLDVRIPWFTSLFETRIESTLNYSAGNRLINMMGKILDHYLSKNNQVLHGFLGIAGKGIILASSLAIYRNSLCSYSRELGAVMPSSWLEINTSSHYNESKKHFVSTKFMKNAQGVVVLVDDAIATGGTLSGFRKSLSEYTNNILALVVLDLTYAKTIKDYGYNGEVLSVFIQDEPEITKYSNWVTSLYNLNTIEDN